ncbi:MAG: alpha-L-fucosidase, partial [Planctomycetota bacterium]
MKKLGLILLVLCGLLIIGYQQAEAKKYEPTWESIRQYKEVPEWLRDGKFGIYTHWGPYAVHAYGSNTTWYSNSLYNYPRGEARRHFEENFGKLTPEFGYKDLIPKFTAEKFDADEWAELFEKAGAKFAGPVAEHHDGFAMWDTKYSDWNAAKMGPKRDVVGELEKAIKKRDMKYVVAFHHAANWFFFPVHDKNYDTGDPKNSGLYGQFHQPGEMRNQEFIDEWYDKIIEVIDNYSPDFIWFDFALDQIPEGYVKDFLAYYYNDATEKDKEVVVTYKGNDVVPGTGVRDLELGQEASITYHEWITDSTVDDRGAWGYADDLVFKSPNRVIDNLVDRVSKNGYLLLNVGPKPDGTIPEEARDLLLEMGKWLEVNGDGIYGTTPWIIASQGPTNLGAATDIGFNE